MNIIFPRLAPSLSTPESCALSNDRFLTCRKSTPWSLNFIKAPLAKAILGISLALCFVVPSIAATNIAPSATLSVDSTNTTYTKDKAVDGIKSDNSSRWVSANTAEPHWFELDWATNQTINNVKVWSGNMTAAGWQIYSYKLQSWSGSAWVDIPGASVTNNTADGYSGQFNDLNFTAVTTAKLRMYITDAINQTGYTDARLFELEVWTPNTNLAPSATVSVDSTNSTYTKDKAVDGVQNDNSSRWISANTAEPHWFELDWSSSQTIRNVRVWSGNMTAAGYQIGSFKVQYWTGSAWQDTGAAVTSNSQDGFSNNFNDLIFPPVTTTKLRLYITDACLFGAYTDARLFEIEVYEFPLSQASIPPPSSPTVTRANVKQFIIDLAEYILSIHPSTGHMGGTGGDYDFVYVQGSYVITLVGAYEITGDTRYINEAKAWSDWFITQQIVYDNGNKGYWTDGGTGSTYIADTSLAALALARTYPYASPAQKASYLLALQRFLQRMQATGFITTPGFYRGSMNVYGDGSSNGYTTATILASALWSSYYHLTGDQNALQIASATAEWVVGTIEADGLLPMYINGARQQTGVEDNINAIGYSALGLATTYRLTPYQDTKAILKNSNIQLNIQWLLAAQTTQGYWSAPVGSAGNIRTPMIGLYLDWYYNEIDHSREDVRLAVWKWYSYLLTNGTYDSNRYRCLVGVFMTDLFTRGSSGSSMKDAPASVWTQTTSADFSAGDISQVVISGNSVILPAGVSGERTYTSSKHDMGGTINGYDAIDFDAVEEITYPNSSVEYGVKLQIRTATTAAGLDSATWYGPTGTTDFYRSSFSQINPIHNGQRWVQYRAILFTGTANYPVSLDAVTIIGNSTATPNDNPFNN